jgi:hypothetical protein
MSNNFSIDNNFIMNSILHALILFSFLSVFFILFIAKVTTDAFQDEADSLVDGMINKDYVDNVLTNITNFILKIPMVRTLFTLLGIESIKTPDPDKLRHIANNFNVNSKLTDAKNNGLFKLIITINIILWIFYIIICIIIKNIDSSFHISEIIIENLIIFIFIGIIEYYFFTKIALKFIPVVPSFISKKFIEMLIQKINID